MDIVDGAVVITVVWSLVAGGYLYLTKWSMTLNEVETMKEQGRQLRQQEKPHEWWQEILVNVSEHPETLEKFMTLANSPGLASVLQQFKPKM